MSSNVQLAKQAKEAELGQPVCQRFKCMAPARSYKNNETKFTKYCIECSEQQTERWRKYSEFISQKSTD